MEWGKDRRVCKEKDSADSKTITKMKQVPKNKLQKSTTTTVTTTPSKRKPTGNNTDMKTTPVTKENIWISGHNRLYMPINTLC